MDSVSLKTPGDAQQPWVRSRAHTSVRLSCSPWHGAERHEGTSFYFLPYLQINFILYKTTKQKPGLNYGSDKPALSQIQLLTYTFPPQH